MLPQPDRTHSLRILLAEDHPVNQKIALLMLQRLGYQADVAENGLEALEALQRQLYDVVLLDVQMPEMDGLEVARQICQQKQPHLRPYLIAMTANAMQGDRERCLQAGMDHYMSKPIKMQALGQILSQCPLLQLPATRPGNTHPPEPTPYSPFTGTPPSEHEALDLAVLADFRQAMGDTGDDVIAELIRYYLIETPRLLQTLHAAMSQQDVKAVQRVAHGLKASSASLGAMTFSQCCGELETMALRASIEQIAVMVACLESEYTCVEAALRQAQ